MQQSKTVDLWTDYTLDFIRAHCDSPWFISLAYIIPHLPWVSDERYSAPFAAQGRSKDLSACYGCISQLDECVGRLLAGLREAGQEQRTVIVFLSDNGATGPDAKRAGSDGFVAGTDWEKLFDEKLTTPCPRCHGPRHAENEGRLCKKCLSWDGKMA